MNEGAVALIDCLGYKGIWKRAEPETVLREFVELRNSAMKSLDEGIFQMNRNHGFRIRMSFLSDTVAIGVDAEQPLTLSDYGRGRMLEVAVLAAQRAVTHFLRMSTPLAVRGCIALGKFDFHDNFLIGPAVDMAAEMHERANGAFVWIPPQFDRFIAAARATTLEMLRQKKEQVDLLTLIPAVNRSYESDAAATAFEQQTSVQSETFKERAREMMREAMLSDHRPYHLLRYDVPLKGGTTVNCWTADPSPYFRDPRELWERYAAAMRSSDIEVIIKFQNTQRFLRTSIEAHQRWTAYWKAHVEKALRSQT